MRYITPAPRDAPCADADVLNECPHDLWLALDLDHGGSWTHYDRFTLRVSWPASVSTTNTPFIIHDFSHTSQHPATVAISLHPPPASESASAHARTARLHLARIRLTEEGVRVPALTHHAIMPVPFVVRLEPLILGVLPASVMPVLATLLVVLTAATYGVVPAVLRVVGDAAAKAGKELEALERRRKG